MMGLRVEIGGLTNAELWNACRVTAADGSDMTREERREAAIMLNEEIQRRGGEMAIRDGLRFCKRCNVAIDDALLAKPETGPERHGGFCSDACQETADQAEHLATLEIPVDAAELTDALIDLLESAQREAAAYAVPLRMAQTLDDAGYSGGTGIMLTLPNGVAFVLDVIRVD